MESSRVDTQANKDSKTLARQKAQVEKGKAEPAHPAATFAKKDAPKSATPAAAKQETKQQPPAAPVKVENKATPAPAPVPKVVASKPGTKDVTIEIMAGSQPI